MFNVNNKSAVQHERGPRNSTFRRQFSLFQATNSHLPAPIKHHNLALGKQLQKNLYDKQEHISITKQQESVMVPDSRFILPSIPAGFLMPNFPSTFSQHQFPLKSPPKWTNNNSNGPLSLSKGHKTIKSSPPPVTAVSVLHQSSITPPASLSCLPFPPIANSSASLSQLLSNIFTMSSETGAKLGTSYLHVDQAKTSKQTAAILENNNNNNTKPFLVSNFLPNMPHQTHQVSFIFLKLDFSFPRHFLI